MIISVAATIVGVALLIFDYKKTQEASVKVAVSQFLSGALHSRKATRQIADNPNAIQTIIDLEGNLSKNGIKGWTLLYRAACYHQNFSSAKQLLIANRFKGEFCHIDILVALSKEPTLECLNYIIQENLIDPDQIRRNNSTLWCSLCKEEFSIEGLKALHHAGYWPDPFVDYCQGLTQIISSLSKIESKPESRKTIVKLKKLTEICVFIFKDESFRDLKEPRAMIEKCSKIAFLHPAPHYFLITKKLCRNPEVLQEIANITGNLTKIDSRERTLWSEIDSLECAKVLIDNSVPIPEYMTVNILCLLDSATLAHALEKDLICPFKGFFNLFNLWSKIMNEKLSIDTIQTLKDAKLIAIDSQLNVKAFYVAIDEIENQNLSLPIGLFFETFNCREQWGAIIDKIFTVGSAPGYKKLIDDHLNKYYLGRRTKKAI